MESTQVNLRTLCNALGFTAVAIQNKKFPHRDAVELSQRIEEFCHSSVPQGKFSVAERMADDIVAIYRENGGCLPQDLNAKGYTPEEVDRHWAMANALAHVKMNMLDS